MPSSPLPAKLLPAEAKHRPKPSAKVVDTTNDGAIELSSHRRAQDEAISAKAAVFHGNNTAPVTPLLSNPPVPPSSKNSTTSTPSASQATTSSASGSSKRKSPPLSVYSTNEDDAPVPRKGPLSKKQRVESSGDEAPSEAEKQSEVLTMKDRSHDIDAFFEPRPKVSAGPKPKRQCILCKKKRLTFTIVCETTTLRRHIQAHHQAAYYEWCLKNKFESKLPKDTKAQKDKKVAEDCSQQSSLDSHLHERSTKERIIPYSDSLFRQAAIEWLIATDQLIQALDHPKFREMISITSRATQGVLVPDYKATRKYIIDLFKKNLTDLQTRLGSDKTGLVSLTCDAWTDTDAYFAVTGHWNETNTDGNWEQKSTLLGFTQVNCSHDGITLGRALYKIIKWLNFDHKVGWVTCDNASNNLTMLQNFGRKLNKSSMREGCKKKWDWEEYHVRCLAHVINLATQALISTYSTAKHFNPHEPDAHEADTEGLGQRDEVGLVRTITVKARSSAKRKEMLRQLQVRENKTPLALLIDMKVRWSSTYIMLKRAIQLEPFLDDFIYEMGREESDLNKCRKIDSLKLSTEEWTRLKGFIDLLECADAAQQAFSYDNTPTLHTALPALKALHKAWTNQSTCSRYAPFVNALEAALTKVEDYYNKTATSHAYTFSMLLDPDMKMEHFKKHWGPVLEKEILEAAEKIFKERYFELYGNNSPPKSTTSKGNKKLAKLMAEYTSDEDDDERSSTPIDTTEPWRQEFN